MQNDTEHRPIAEINVTPMVDVMFVLLVLFLVSMPLLLPQTLGIDLPDTQPHAAADFEEPHRISIHADGKVELNGQIMTDEQLPGRLTALAEDSEVRVLLEADKSVRYERLAQVIVDAQVAGIARIGFLTEAENR